MIPFESKCCKCSKLLVDLFLVSYSNCTALTGILKYCTALTEILENCTSYLRSYECVKLMDSN